MTFIRSDSGSCMQHLIGKDMSIYEVCYDCGFNNLSNFNRYFKKIMNKPPSKYKREFINMGYEVMDKLPIDNHFTTKKKIQTILECCAF
jgi:hypothetical protein